MVVSHAHKYLFIEVPSTGSTAITAELTEHYGGETILRKHANYTEFRQKYGVKANDYFVFATVRNPLDMVVTEFAKLKGNHKKQYTTPSAFERNGGFVPDKQLEEFAFIHENKAEFSDFFLRFRGQIYHNWYLVCHSRFNYVMRYENLAEEFEKVLRALGLVPVRALQRVNKTTLKTRHFTEYYTPATYSQARRCYGPFMKQWGYQFPSQWGGTPTPIGTTCRFRSKEVIVNAIGRIMTIDPFSPHVQEIKKVVDRIL